MSKLKFINALEAEISKQTAKKVSMRDQLVTLEKEAAAKKDEVEELQQAFSKSMDSEVLDKVTVASEELDRMVARIGIVKKSLNSTSLVSVANDIGNELDQEVERLKVLEKKAKIELAIAALNEAVDDYGNALNSIIDTGHKVVQMQEKVDSECMAQVKEWYEHNYPKYYAQDITDKYKSYGLGSKIQDLLYKYHKLTDITIKLD